MKDLAYFVGSCLDESQCQEREAEILDYYFSRLSCLLAVQNVYTRRCVVSVCASAYRPAELQQQYHLSLQSRTDARIRTLTILSSICMPLTLIAGIYGMNFEMMPELDESWGYPVTLSLMGLIAGGQLVFFYRQGWFR